MQITSTPVQTEKKKKQKHLPPPLPTKIRVLGKDFDVIYVPDLKDEEDGDILYGQVEQREFKILINASCSYETQRATLVHEALHAALEVAGLHQLLEEKTEEAIITCLEHAFADIVDIYALSVPTDESVDNLTTPGV